MPAKRLEMYRVHASTNPFTTGIRPIGSSANPFLSGQLIKPSLNQLGTGSISNSPETSIPTGFGASDLSGLPPPLQAVPTLTAKAAVASRIAHLAPATSSPIPVASMLTGMIVPYCQPLPFGQTQTQASAQMQQQPAFVSAFTPLSGVQPFPTSYPKTAQTTGLNPFY
ncbi:unnamed protein product [Protopolystoma xenopodis]|uniref:Uncharacterized protein n=1 Tax=Protopolystoma xenopodis TaxID=117903 RepID=A0A448XK32_9PLAT|nr:unnamed protein product [Protopolystoma xenopodis]